MKFLVVAATIAWRELRATPLRFVFVILAVAVGVGALSGVKGFGAAFRSMLFRNARQLTASDLTAQVWAYPTPQQLGKLTELGERVGDVTWVTETVSMAAKPGNVPQMVAVKAVDPSRYPFYGKPTLEPDRSLATLLGDGQVLANQELLIRLRLKPGDALRLGGRDFHVAGTIITEPDRLASGFGPSMRVLMNRRSLQQTGLIQPGSRASERFLFKIRPGADLSKLKTDLQQILVRPRLTDFRDGDAAIERGINRSTTFLSLISLIALVVGSIGVGMAMRSHIDQKMDTIAVMKAVGARSRQVLAIYLIQTLSLGLLGGVLGVAVGALVQKLFPVLIHQVFALLPEVEWDWSFSLQGLGLGVLATLLFTLPPLARIWRVRPNLVFRREMQENSDAAGWRSGQYLASLSLIAAGFVGISFWLSGSWRTSAYFVGGLAAGLLVLSLVAAALLWSAKRVVQRMGRRLPANFRHGFANLYRPGTHAAAVLVALGVGVLFTTTTYLVQQTIIRDVRTDAPAEAGNMFLLDVRPSERAALTEFIRSQPGVRKPPELIGYFVARLVEKNGTPAAQLPLPKERKDQLQTSRLSVVETLPKEVEVSEGKFWPRAAEAAQVAISEGEGRRFGLKLGDRLQFQAAGKILNAPVVAVFRPKKRTAFRFDILFPHSAMGSIPAVYFGAAQVDPKLIPQLEQTLFEQFPTITVMNLSDILTRIEDAVNQVAVVIRFLAAFAIFAGVIILSSSVAGSRQRRLREVAILKTMGATKRRVVAIFSIEFTILGAVAGLIGGILANLFTRVIAAQVIDAPFHFEPWSVPVAMAAMVVLANLAGWLASLRVLDLRPLEVLRAE